MICSPSQQRSPEQTSDASIPVTITTTTTTTTTSSSSTGSMLRTDEASTHRISSHNNNNNNNRNLNQHSNLHLNPNPNLNNYNNFHQKNKLSNNNTNSLISQHRVSSSRLPTSDELLVDSISPSVVTSSSSSSSSSSPSSPSSNYSNPFVKNNSQQRVVKVTTNPIVVVNTSCGGESASSSLSSSISFSSSSASSSNSCRYQYSGEKLLRAIIEPSTEKEISSNNNKTSLSLSVKNSSREDTNSYKSRVYLNSTSSAAVNDRSNINKIEIKYPHLEAQSTQVKEEETTKSRSQSTRVRVINHHTNSNQKQDHSIVHQSVPSQGIDSSSGSNSCIVNYRSSSFKLNPSTNSTAATQRPVSSYNNQPHYHSDLSNLSLIYLKKGVSSSSSFHNKINLYSNNRHTSDSTSDSTQQKDEEQEGEFQMDHKQTPKIMSSMESLLTTATNNHRSQRPLSTNLNTANVNRRIGPIVASAASNCNLVSAGVSGGLGAGFTDILKPPLPHQSLSSFKEVEQIEQQRSSRKQQQQHEQEEIAKNEELKQSSKMTTTPIAKYSGESGANTPRESSGGHREDLRSSSEFYELSKNSKRWRSMYALRDSIRNLTACVSTKSSHFSSSNKKNGSDNQPMSRTTLLPGGGSNSNRHHRHSKLVLEPHSSTKPNSTAAASLIEPTPISRRYVADSSASSSSNHYYYWNTNSSQNMDGVEVNHSYEEDEDESDQSVDRSSSDKHQDDIDAGFTYEHERLNRTLVSVNSTASRYQQQLPNRSSTALASREMPDNEKPTESRGSNSVRMRPNSMRMMMMMGLIDQRHPDHDHEHYTTNSPSRHHRQSAHIIDEPKKPATSSPMVPKSQTVSENLFSSSSAFYPTSTSRQTTARDNNAFYSSSYLITSSNKPSVMTTSTPASNHRLNFFNSSINAVDNNDDEVFIREDLDHRNSSEKHHHKKQQEQSLSKSKQLSVTSNSNTNTNTNTNSGLNVTDDKSPIETISNSIHYLTNNNYQHQNQQIHPYKSCTSLVTSNVDNKNGKNNTIKKIKIKKKRTINGRSSVYQPSNLSTSLFGSLGTQSESLFVAATTAQTVDDNRSVAKSTKNSISSNDQYLNYVDDEEQDEDDDNDDGYEDALSDTKSSHSRRKFIVATSSGSNVSSGCCLSGEDKEDKDDALCDMIERFQGNRLDNQRCELNALNALNSIHDDSITKFFDKLPISSNDKKSTTTSNNKASSQREKPTATRMQQQQQQQTTPTTTNNTVNNIAQVISTRASIKQTTSERLSKIVSGIDHSYQPSAQIDVPMVSLPENDNYWCEGWGYTSTNEDQHHHHQHHANEDLIASSTSSLSASTSSSPSPSPSSQSSSVVTTTTPSKLNANNNTFSCFDFDSHSLAENTYRESFAGKEHLVFYGLDLQDAPFVLSCKMDQIDKVEHVRAILRTRETNFFSTIPFSEIEEPITPQKIIRTMNADYRVKIVYPLVYLNAFKLVTNFDNHTINKNFKFGVVYMKKGQITEEELFSNQEHSEAFDNFLGLLGNRIKLKDFTGFRGGLDTSHGQTGEYSIYENYQEKEIMFHVSTLLPYNKNDHQQLERKRHIGNDIVAVIFQEDNTPFAPDMIASNFLHAFIVVQKIAPPPDASSHRVRYKVCVTARRDVPMFGPPHLNHECVYEHDDNFKDWLLAKLINAEYACYKAEKFRKLKERTRSSLLDALYSDLHQQNQKVFNLMFPNMMSSMAFGSQAPQTGSNDQQTSRSHLHLGSLSNQGGTSMSTRVAGSSTSSSGSPTSTTPESSSNSFVSAQQNSPPHHNHHQINSTTSFKFNLINTVRKAFKKNSLTSDAATIKEHPSHHSSQGNLNKIGTNSSQSQKSTTTTQSPPPSYSAATTNLYSESEAIKAGRLRSSTYDSTAVAASLANSGQFKQQFKQLQQDPLPRQNETHKISGRKLFKSEKSSSSSKKQAEYNMNGKMGSMDNISNIENYSNLALRKSSQNSPIQSVDLVNTNPNVVSKTKLFNNSTNINNSIPAQTTAVNNSSNLNSSLTDLTSTNNLGSSPLTEEQEEILLGHEQKSVIIQTLMNQNPNIHQDLYKNRELTNNVDESENRRFSSGDYLSKTIPYK